MPEGEEQGEIGQRVRAAIQRAGRTQAEVARGLGMSAPAFSRLLKQGRNLKLPQLQRIAVLCGVKFEELIGKTSGDPERRLKAVQVSSPFALECIGLVYGTADLEGELHRRFAGSHLRGEWFEPSDELLEYVRQLAPPSALPPVELPPPQPVRLDQFSDILSIADLARLLGVCKGTAYQAVRQGMIPSSKLGNRIFVTKAALEAWLQSGGE